MANFSTQCRLGDLISIKHGFAFKSEYFSSQGPFVLLTPGNFVEAGGFRWLGDKQKFYDGPVPNAFILSPGDMLIAMTEQAPGLLGSTFFLPEGQKYLHNQRLGLIRVQANEHLVDRYLHYYLSLPDTRRIISAESTGTKVKHTSPERLYDLNISLPSLLEQRKIVEILRTWDEALEKLTELRAAKARRLNGIAQRLLAPSRAIGQEFSRSNWNPSSFGDVFEERQDKNTDLGADDVVTVGKYAIRKQSEHFTRSVASKDLSNYWTISPGDFVYDPMSAYYGAIGRFSGSSDGIVSPAYRVIRLSADVDPEFMVTLLQTHHIRFLLETRSSQGNKIGKRRLLQRNEFESIEFKLPPIETQRDIASKIAVFQAELALTDREIEALRRQKRGLMQKLLTGEWRVSC
ncbi:MAG: restriction endonuclease subunit S [Halomonas sp.]|nr:restriction endonuclease subunit S [Halomonas sp.]MDM7483375.1 restriction endonuclease subunit S [Halomonas sp.]